MVVSSYFTTAGENAQSVCIKLIGGCMSTYILVVKSMSKPQCPSIKIHPMIPGRNSQADRNSSSISLRLILQAVSDGNTR